MIMAKRAMHHAVISRDSVLAQKFDVELNEPGIARHFAIGMKEAPIIAGSIIQPGASQHINGQKMMEIVPTIFFEVDPEAPKRNRHFVLVRIGQTVETDESLVYHGAFILPPHGEPLFVFEEVTI
jgi:hypothetical protein